MLNCLLAAVSKDASVSAGDQLLSIDSIIEAVSADSFPVNLPDLVFCTVWECDATDRRTWGARFIAEADGGVFHEREVTIDFGAARYCRQVARMQGLQIAGPGLLRFVIRADEGPEAVWLIPVSRARKEDVRASTNPPPGAPKVGRKASIDAVISTAEEEFELIYREYNKSLRKHVIDPSLQVEIKNFCGNLRSALDYVAHDIREKYCPGAKRALFYFPITDSQASFESKTGEWFPGLSTNAGSLWKVLLDAQPFQSGMSWLSKFNKLNNENKHGNLVPQSRKETTQHSVRTADGGKIVWDPNKTNFGSMTVGGIPITKPFSSEPSRDSRLETSTTVWVDFVFDGIDQSAMSLLQRSIYGVKEIIAKCQPFLWA